MTAPPQCQIGLLQRRSRAPFAARIPGSKAVTHRALLLAAMRRGTTEVASGLDCEDTQRLAAALNTFAGLRVHAHARGFTVVRSAARLGAPHADLDCGGAGTAARFLLAFAAAAEGATVVTGGPRLCERPMGDLLATLRDLGIRCDSLEFPDCLPVRVHGGTPSTRHWRVQTTASSQFTSALLLLASQHTGAPVEIALEGREVSLPYVELTRTMLRRCGVHTERRPGAILVHPGEPQCARIEVEPDASSMGYFLAMAAVTGTTVEVAGIARNSGQADVDLLRAFERMGCRTAVEADRVRLTGAPLCGIDIDMADMPDAALTLAVVAVCANSPTRITNIGQLRDKECDRLAVAATELARLGRIVSEGPDWLHIWPGGAPRPSVVQTHDDHRVAMAFSILGLVQPGIAIADPGCVAKSFPGYWAEFERFCAHHDGANG